MRRNVAAFLYMEERCFESIALVVQVSFLFVLVSAALRRI